MGKKSKKTRSGGRGAKKKKPRQQTQAESGTAVADLTAPKTVGNDGVDLDQDSMALVQGQEREDANEKADLSSGGGGGEESCELYGLCLHGRKYTLQEVIEFVESTRYDDPWNNTRVILFAEYCVDTWYKLRNYDEDNDDNNNNNNNTKPVTEVERKFLRSIVRAEDSDPAFFVAFSTLCLAFIARKIDYNRDEWCRCMNNAIIACDSATREETSRLLDFAPRPLQDLGPTIGDFLDFIRVTAARELQLMRNGNSDCSDLLATNGSYIPGDHCDGCSAKATKPINKMPVCARCRFTYYCSMECQKKHWKSMHKYLCRKKGEFRVGDKVETLQPFGTVKIGRPCWILAPADDDDDDDDGDSWIVCDVKGEQLTVISGDKLRVSGFFVRGAVYKKEVVGARGGEVFNAAAKKLIDEWKKKLVKGGISVAAHPGVTDAHGLLD